MDLCWDCGARLKNPIRKYCPSCQYEREKKREAEEKKRRRKEWRKCVRKISGELVASRQYARRR